METRRFRNHYSSVFEKISTVLLSLIIIIIFNLGEDTTMEETGEVVKGLISSIYLLVGIGIFLLLVGIVIGIMSWSWSKTWIVLEENSISVEKNTLTFSKNTLGIKDISNVNLEQNLFEMIIGTSKVKINTNSLSTASTTDLKIILKKKEAEELKNYLNQRINQLNQNENTTVDKTENEQNTENNKCDYIMETSPKDILLNSIYSMNLVGSLIFASIACGFITNILDFIFGTDVVDNLLYEYLSTAVVIIVVVVSVIVVLVWSCVKNYIRMYNFSIKRVGDKIGIKYGMLKQVEFSIPVDKINAIVIHQTFIARLFRKYSAEMINVGMGDEKEEDTYFCLYGTKEHLIDTIQNILPEFAESLDVKIERQPKKTIIMKAVGVTIWMLILCSIGAVVNFFVENAFIYVISVLCFVLLLSIVISVLSFCIDGLGTSKQYCCIRAGAFATKKTIIKFDKIQYITSNKNPITSKLGLVISRVNILAMAGKNTEVLPYITEEKFEEISNKLIK